MRKVVKNKKAKNLSTKFYIQEKRKKCVCVWGGGGGGGGGIQEAADGI